MTKSLNLIGAAGEYYVCAELCKLGYLALLTTKNNPIFDVIASNHEGTQTVHIQVKTRAIDNKQGWKISKNIMEKRNNENSYVILVNLLEKTLPEFYIYKYDLFTDKVKELYDNYLNTPKKNGEKRKDVGFRWYDEASITKNDLNRKNNWEPIILKLKKEQ